MIDASHYLDCNGHFALRIVGFSNAKTNGNAKRARQAVDGHHDDTCNAGGVEGFVARGTYKYVYGMEGHFLALMDWTLTRPRTPRHYK
jgi:hypothetical protein